MSGYRDDQEAQRMRVASLEERLAELEAENEGLRVREAETETPIVVDVGTHEPASPPTSPRLSKDVAETLASLKAMAGDIALSDAEKAQEQTAPLAPTPLNPELVNLATAAKTAPRPLMSALMDSVPIVSLAQLRRTPDSDFRADETAVRASYWSGVRDGMFASILFIGCFVLLVLMIRP